METDGKVSARPLGRLRSGRLLPAIDRTHLVFGGVALILIVLVVSPLVQLMIQSLQHEGTGAATLDNYVQAFTNQRHLVAIWHSILLGLAVATLCVILGVPMAWAVAQTNMPGKSIVSLLVLTAFITPDYLNSISWILLAGPNAGWINRAFVAVTGSSSGILNIYSFWGIAFVVSISALPYVFIFTATALRSIGAEMIDAGRILGAGVLRTTFGIVLPLVLPAILGGAIVTFLEAIAIFGTPALIGLPARYTVISTQLWEFFGFPMKVEVACAYSVPLVLLTVGLFWLQKRMTKRRGYIVQTGKAAVVKPIDLGPYRWVALAGCLLVLSLVVVLPYLTLIEAAFSRAWGAGLSWSNLTLDNFYSVMTNPAIESSMLHTFTYALAAAILAVTLGSLVAYAVVRRIIPFGQILSIVCLAPFVIPGMVLAIGFYAAYAPAPLALYGTATIIIFAFTTRFLPIAFANASAAMRTINPDMENQVRNLGGDRVLAVRYVVFPMLKQSLIGAGILVFIPALRELSTAIFLSVEDTRTVSVMIFDLSEQGRLETLAALGIVLLFSTIVVVGIGFKLIGRDFLLRRDASW